MSFSEVLPRRGRPAERRAFWLYALHLWSIFGLALSNALLVLALLIVPWAVRRQEIDWRRLAPVLTPLGLYAVLLGASVALSYRPLTSLGELRELLSLATLLLGLLLLRSERRVRLAVDGLIAVAAILALFGLGQILIGYGDLHRRIQGPFSHYMTFAGVLLIAALLLVAQLSRGRHGRWGWRWWALLPITLALVGSLTRSAWVAFAVALTVLLMIRAPRWLLAYLPAAALFVMLAPEPVLHRALSIADLDDVSNYDRLCMAEAGLHMVRERPLFGLGPGMVEQRYPLYRHPTAPTPRVPHLHNVFVQLAAERGLLSLAAYLWLLGGALWAAYRGYRGEAAAAGGRADLYLGAGVALFAFSLAGLFEDNWSDTEVQRIALFLIAVPFALRALPRPAADPAVTE